MRIEYDAKNNRFPFFRAKDKAVSVAFDNQDELCELDFIYDKITQKYPSLKAEVFYGKLNKIQKDMGDSPDQVKLIKQESDKLLKNIRNFIQDEEFIHKLYDTWEIGIDKVIGTIYSVYGYYFYTGKRTANVIKKTLKGYKKPPVH